MIVEVVEFRDTFIKQHQWGTRCFSSPETKCAVCSRVLSCFPLFAAYSTQEMARWAFYSKIEWYMPSDAPTGINATKMPVASIHFSPFVIEDAFTKEPEHGDECEHCGGLLRCKKSVQKEQDAREKKPFEMLLWSYKDVAHAAVHIAFAHTFCRYFQTSDGVDTRALFRLYMQAIEIGIFTRATTGIFSNNNNNNAFPL